MGIASGKIKSTIVRRVSPRQICPSNFLINIRDIIRRCLDIDEKYRRKNIFKHDFLIYMKFYLNRLESGLIRTKIQGEQ